MKTIQEMYKKELEGFINDCIDIVTKTYEEFGEFPLTAMGMICEGGEYKTFVLNGIDRLNEQSDDDNDIVIDAIKSFNQEIKPVVFVIASEAEMYLPKKEIKTVEDLEGEDKTRVLSLKFETYDQEMMLVYKVEDNKVKEPVDLSFNKVWRNKDESKAGGRFNNLLNENYSELASLLKEQLGHDLN